MTYLKLMMIRLFQLWVLLILAYCASCESKNSRKNNTSAELKDQYVGDELSVQHGMELFNLHCAGCHNFRANEIGPNLSGVTTEMDKAWIIAFIRNPNAIIESGDNRAVELFERYKLYMPAFPHIKDRDLDDLLGFIHKFSEAEKRNQSLREGGLLNPIPERIQNSGLVLELKEWLTVPPSSESPPLARINKLAAIKTEAGESLFLADLQGKLYEIVGDTVSTYLDIRTQEHEFIHHPGFGTGLGSFAFHPGFEKNGLLYTTHTEAPRTSPADFAVPDSIPATLQWVLTEWKTDDPRAGTFSGDKREVLRADMVTPAHGFQEITFNPLSKPGEDDYGMLYLGIGDGGAALSGYPFLCDNDKSIWGSVIRIDPAGNNSKNGMYGIPEDNPFAGEPDKLGEIWCRGFRNPHRISWDESGSGKMFISNIGQHSVEEVNLGKMGGDYGWPNREGSFLFDVNANTELVYPLESEDSLYTPPVIQYDHDEGNAVSGGFAYSGDKIPMLKNKYIFGDIPRGTIFFSMVPELTDGHQAPVYRLALEIDGKEMHLSDISLDARVDLRFGVDSSGELFIFTKNDGKVYKVVGCRERNASESPAPVSR